MLQNKKLAAAAIIGLLGDVLLDVTARMVDALEQSRGMNEHDFVKIKGEYLDGSIKITGVSKLGSWDTDQEDS